MAPLMPFIDAIRKPIATPRASSVTPPIASGSGL
jgi:hypothetical protein